VPESQPGVFTRARQYFTGHYDPSASYAEVDVSHLIKQYEDALKEVQSLKRKLYSTETRAQQDMQQWTNNLRKFENQLEKERSEKLQYQKKVDKIAAHIDNQEFFIGIQMSDSGILGIWQSLWVQVKGWSVAFSCEQPIDKKLVEEQKVWVKIFRTIAPGDPKLRWLDKRKTRREFVQAIVGYTLAEGIFRRLSNDAGFSFGADTPYEPVPDHWAAQKHSEAIDNLERAFSQGQYDFSSAYFCVVGNH